MLFVLFLGLFLSSFRGVAANIVLLEDQCRQGVSVPWVPF